MNNASSRLFELARKRKPGMEFNESTEATSLQADDTLHQVASALTKLPADEMGDPAEFQRAMGIFMEHAEKALKSDPLKPLDNNSRIAFEAVIRTDGTRPSLFRS